MYLFGKKRFNSLVFEIQDIMCLFRCNETCLLANHTPISSLDGQTAIAKEL